MRLPPKIDVDIARFNSIRATETGGRIEGYSVSRFAELSYMRELCIYVHNACHVLTTRMVNLLNSFPHRPSSPVTTRREGN